MNRQPQQQTNPVNEIYRQVHQSQSAVNQGIEWYHNQCLAKDEQIQSQQRIIDDLQKKIDDLQPNLKKVPNKPDPTK